MICHLHSERVDSLTQSQLQIKVHWWSGSISQRVIWLHNRNYMKYCKRKTSLIAAWGVICLILLFRQILQVHAIPYVCWCNPYM